MIRTAVEDLDAVTFDAMGTLIHLVEPGPLLRVALLSRYGIAASDARCAGAKRAEIAHYVQHAPAARTTSDAARLRLACAGIVADVLRVGLEAADVLPLLADAIRYEPMNGAQATLTELRAAGLRLAVVSNFDATLRRVLSLAGLAASLDLTLSASELTVRKPDPTIYEEAARRLGSVPGRILHVGDDPVGDVDAAISAGYRGAVLVDAHPGPPARRPRIAALPELMALLDVARGRMTG